MSGLVGEEYGAGPAVEYQYLRSAKIALGMG